jgi:hypothetical protein
MHLYAPFDGTVVEKQGEEGEVIATMAMSSSLGRTAVVTIANLEKMDVEADINENKLSLIRVGQPAEIKVKATFPKVYHGRLRQVMPMGDRTRSTVKVKVEILDPDEKLFPELYADVISCRTHWPIAPAGPNLTCSSPSRPSFPKMGMTMCGFWRPTIGFKNGKLSWRRSPTTCRGSIQALRMASRSSSIPVTICVIMRPFGPATDRPACIPNLHRSGVLARHE